MARLKKFNFAHPERFTGTVYLSSGMRSQPNFGMLSWAMAERLLQWLMPNANIVSPFAVDIQEGAIDVRLVNHKVAPITDRRSGPEKMEVEKARIAAPTTVTGTEAIRQIFYEDLDLIEGADLVLIVASPLLQEVGASAGTLIEVLAALIHGIPVGFLHSDENGSRGEVEAEILLPRIPDGLRAKYNRARRRIYEKVSRMDLIDCVLPEDNAQYSDIPARLSYTFQDVSLNDLSVLLSVLALIVKTAHENLFNSPITDFFPGEDYTPYDVLESVYVDRVRNLQEVETNE